MKPSSAPCSTPEDSLTLCWLSRRKPPTATPATADPPITTNSPAASSKVDRAKSTPSSFAPRRRFPDVSPRCAAVGCLAPARGSADYTCPTDEPAHAVPAARDDRYPAPDSSADGGE